MVAERKEGGGDVGRGEAFPSVPEATALVWSSRPDPCNLLPTFGLVPPPDRQPLPSDSQSHFPTAPPRHPRGAPAADLPRLLVSHGPPPPPPPGAPPTPAQSSGPLSLPRPLRPPGLNSPRPLPAPPAHPDPATTPRCPRKPRPPGAPGAAPAPGHLRPRCLSALTSGSGPRSPRPPAS